MFENITAEVLNRLLGSYVSPSSFQTDRVSTSVYKGHVLLSRLELREDAIDRLLLPVTLKKGIIMKAEISIPWTQLGSKPIELSLDGVYLLLNPKTQWTDDEIERRAQASKASRLVQAELIKRSREAMLGLGKLVDGTSPDASFTSRLVSRITDNVEIRLRNIHIRFDDGMSFCFGMTLESLSMQTTDVNWIPRFKESSDGQTHKLCKLEKFSIYGDQSSVAAALNSASEDAFIKFFAEGIPHRERARGHAYIVRPMDASLRLTMHRETPGTKLEFFCKSLDVRLEAFQVANAVHVQKVFSSAPSSTVAILTGLKRPLSSPMQDPRGWWLYAYSFVVKKLKEKKYKWSKTYFTKRRRDRLEYILLWKRHLVGGFADDNTRNYAALSAQDRVRLEWLEKCLEFNDIMLFRSYAENELRLEKAHQELWELTTAKGGTVVPAGSVPSSSNAAVASGWVSWALGMSSAQNSGNLKESLSQHDVERFLAVLRHNPAVTVLENSSSSDTVVAMVISFVIPKGSLFFNPVRIGLRWIDLEWTRRMNGSSVISAAIEHFQINDGFQRVLGPRGEYFKRSNRVRSATMDDLAWTKNGSPRHQMNVKKLDSLDSLDLATQKILGDANSAMPRKRREDGLLYVKLDTNPVQVDLDRSFSMKIGPLEAIYSATLIEKMIQTFATLPGHPSSPAVAPAPVSLRHSRIAVAVDFDLRNFSFILPMGLSRHSSDPSAALVFELGRFSIQDQAIRTKAQVTLALESNNVQDERLYDNYTVHISRLFVWLFSVEAKRRLSIVERFTVRAVVGRSVQSLPQLPRVKVSVEALEVINIRLSTRKLALMERIIQNVVSHSKPSMDNVDVKHSYQKCPFVHAIPPSGEGDDEELSILNEVEEVLPTKPGAPQQDQAVAEPGLEFDANSEFFSVLGDDIDERENFVTRNQRFFDALHGDDAQSEARFNRTNSRRRIHQVEQDQTSGNGGRPEEHDDQQSFFTADSSFKKSKSKAPLARRTSQISSRRDEASALHISVKLAGLAVYISQVTQREPTRVLGMGSPHSAVTYQQTHPNLSLKRNTSSILATATPSTTEKRELPVHVQSWLDELRQLEGTVESSTTTVTPIVPLPSSSPPPNGSGWKRKNENHDSDSEELSSNASSVAAHIMDDEATETSEHDVWEDGKGKELVSLIVRLDSVSAQLDAGNYKRVLDFSLGHAIVEEVLERGDENIFSRYIVHTGLRMDSQDRLSFQGDEEEAAFVGHVLMFPQTATSFNTRARDAVSHVTEMSVAMQRPIDIILNTRIMRDSLVPLVTEISAVLNPPERRQQTNVPHQTVKPNKLITSFSQFRVWLVDDTGPFVLVKANKLDFTLELDKDTRAHLQGRLADLDGSFYSADFKQPFVFVSRRSDMTDDENVPLASFVGIHHPTLVDKNEILVTPTPREFRGPTPPSVFLTDEDLADQVIDSILVSSTRSPSHSPIADVTMLESVHVDFQGDEVFVNVLPIKFAVCEAFAQKMIGFVKTLPAPRTTAERKQSKAIGRRPLSLRYIFTSPLFELVDMEFSDLETNTDSAGTAPKRAFIAIGCQRLESANKLFLSSGAGEDEQLLERTDLIVNDAFVEANSTRLTHENFEIKSRNIGERARIWVSLLDLRLNPAQIQLLTSQLGMYADIAVASTPMSGSLPTKALFEIEFAQVNVGLVALLNRGPSGEKRGLIVRQHASASSSPSARQSSTMRTFPTVPNTTPTCFVMIRLSKVVARAVNYVSLSIEMNQLIVQQGYATVRKNNFIQLVSLPQRSRLSVQLNPKTFLIDSMGVKVSRPRFVYVPETFQDCLTFRSALHPAESGRLSPLVANTSTQAKDAFSKVEVEVSEIEVWLGGGNFSSELLVMNVDLLLFVDSPRDKVVSLKCVGCSAFLKRDKQLPLTSPSLVFQSSSSTPFQQGASLLSAPIDEEENRAFVLPLDVMLTKTANDVHLSVSPVRLHTSLIDISALATILRDLNASLPTTASGTRPASTIAEVNSPTNDLLALMKVLRVEVASVLVLYYNEFTFPIVRVMLNDFVLAPCDQEVMTEASEDANEDRRNSVESRIVARGSVRIKAEHHFKREWEVLMDSFELLAMLSALPFKLRLFSETPISVNLMQSLLDGRDSVREESEKIKHLVNQSGLQAKRIIGRDEMSDLPEDCFCIVGDSLRFRLSSKSSGRSWITEMVKCPRRGGVVKHSAVLEERAQEDAHLSMLTVVFETDQNSAALVIKSPLQVRNDTTQPLELAVSIGVSVPVNDGASTDEVPSRSTTPDSVDTLTSPPSSQMTTANVVRRPRSRARTPLAQFTWSATLSPNEQLFVPADIAHAILSGRFPLLLRPRAQVSSAPDYGFAELRLSYSAQMNQRAMKKSVAFTDFGSFSSTNSMFQKENLWTSHYVCESQWTDPFSQCLIFSAPVLLTNHLNGSVTYRLCSEMSTSDKGANETRAEGQLPMGAELKWHGQAPNALHLLRLSIKVTGFEWSESVALLTSPLTSITRSNDEEPHAVSIDLRDDAERVLRVDAFVIVRRAGRVEVALSVPYWIVNNTDVPLLMASSVMDALGSKVSAGQSRVIAKMRRIRLINQIEEERRSRRRVSSSNRTRILTASNSAPAGLLELLEDVDLDTGGEIDSTHDLPDDSSATTTMFASSQLKIRFWDSRWSDSCGLDHSTVLECKQEWRVRDPALSRALYVVAVKVEQSKSSPRTKVVTLSPRFVLVNALGRALKVRQWRGNLGELARSRSSLSSTPVFSGSREAKLVKDRFASTRGSGIVSLSPGERAAFHWRDKGGPRQLSACFDEFGWEWSPGIAIEDCVGEFCSRMRNRHTQRVYILRVDVQMVDDSCVIVTFRPELPGLPPYRIDNLSLQTIRFRQFGAPISSSETILPYHSCAYTWDLLDNQISRRSQRKLLVEAIARTDELDGAGVASERLFSFALAADGWLRPSQHARTLGVFSLDTHFGYLPSSLTHVGVALHADGPTRVLTVSDARVMSARPLSHLDDQQVHFHSQPDETTPSIRKSRNSFDFEMDIKAFGVSLIEESASSARREFLRVSVFRAALASSVTADGDPVFSVSLGDLQVDNQLMRATYPVLLCSNKRTKDGEDNREFLAARLVKSDRFPNLDFLKSFTLRIAPLQLNLDADIIQTCVRFFADVNPAGATLTKGPPARNVPPSITIGDSPMKKAYVEDLRVDPIEVRVNFHGALALLGASQWFGAHLEGASLYLREFRIVHSLLSASDPIANRVFAHYMQALRRHWYVLISSVDLLGDPIGLAKTLYTGLLDSISEIVSSVSWEGGFASLKMGLIRASLVLVRAAVVGISSSVVNVCNGASAALTSVSSSPFVTAEFRNPRGFFETVAQGIAGLVILPSRGFEKGGTRGFALGAVKGVFGVFARPLAGALKLIARVADSLRGAVDPTSKVRMNRARSPRFLRCEQPLGEFDEHRTDGEAALWSMGMSSDVWMDHLVCSEKYLVILTETRLVVISRFNQELLGIVFTVERTDVVCAAALTNSQHPTVALYCLPGSRDAFRASRDVYWSGFNILQASERRFRRLRFAFEEKIIRCSNGEACFALIEMLEKWIVRSNK